jgi:hypothetical protein
VKCPRCTKDATLVGVESFGERFQCRFYTNEWNEVLDSTVIPEPPAPKWLTEGAALKHPTPLRLTLEKKREPRSEKFNVGALAMLSELDAYLVDQMNALSDRMRLAGDHDDYVRLSGGNAHLAITLDLVRALKKRY